MLGLQNNLEDSLNQYGDLGSIPSVKTNIEFVIFLLDIRIIKKQYKYWKGKEKEH